MIENRTIICIANSWDYDPTCKHQIMKVLAEKNQVVWINYHGTRRPRVTRTDARAAINVLTRVMRKPKRESSSFIQSTPLVLPGFHGKWSASIQRRLLVSHIRRTLCKCDASASRPVQLWTFAPDVPFLVGEFDEECSLYYCTDDHAQFDGVDAEWIRKNEHELTQCVDIVVTTAQALWNERRRSRPDTLLMSHGVDFDHFADSWRIPLLPPEDIGTLPKPRIGFFGLIHHWIDVELLRQVARIRPEYSFILIGDVKVDVSCLRACPNVTILGRRPYGSLPAYCAGFDAALLPFVQSRMTPTINPIKMYEYLAAGLPIIATPMAEAQRFAGPIRFATTPTHFAKACDETVRDDYSGRRESISRVVATESWKSKVESLSHAIRDRIENRRNSDRTSAPPAELIGSAARIATQTAGG